MLYPSNGKDLASTSSLLRLLVAFRMPGSEKSCARVRILGGRRAEVCVVVIVWCGWVGGVMLNLCLCAHTHICRDLHIALIEAILSRYIALYIGVGV